jgi:3-deoxy-7-phosphoheptulonate synthase
MHTASKVTIDDVRIKEIKELNPPSHVLREFPATKKAAETTLRRAARSTASSSAQTTACWW